MNTAREDQTTESVAWDDLTAEAKIEYMLEYLDNVLFEASRYDATETIKLLKSDDEEEQFYAMEAFKNSYYYSEMTKDMTADDMVSQLEYLADLASESKWVIDLGDCGGYPKFYTSDDELLYSYEDELRESYNSED